MFEYSYKGESYLLTTKYIAELDLYLFVGAKIDHFTQSVKDAFYFSIIISLFITSLITVIVILYVRNIHRKLASNNALTGLPNRRSFHNQLEHSILLKARRQQSLSLVFIDVDDFKKINDTQGY